MPESTAAERLGALASRYQEAKAEALRRRDDLAAEVRSAARNGMPETQIARHAGVTRMTVRAWIRQQN